MLESETIFIVVVFILFFAVLAFFLVMWRRPEWIQERWGGNRSPAPNVPATVDSEEVIHLKDIAKQIVKLNTTLDYTNRRLESIEQHIRQLDTRLHTIEHNTRPLKLGSTGGMGAENQSFNSGSRVKLGELREVVPKPPPAPRWAGTLDEARRIYQQLGDRDAHEGSVKIFNVDLDSSFEGAVIGEVNHLFKQTDSKHSQFVIIQRDERRGWLFPNPTILFTESMNVVFPQLSREQFDNDKNHIEPLLVGQTTTGAWERAV